MQLEILKGIAGYLLTNESVSIPGVGSFKLQTVNDDFVKSGDQLHPPRKSLSYDEKATDDVRFISYIQEEFDVSEQVVRSLLAEFSASVSTALASKNSFEFPGLGKMIKKDSNRRFEALDVNFHSEYLYYPSISLKEIPQKLAQKEPVSEQIEKVGKVSAIHKVNAPETEEKSEVASIKVSKMEENNYQYNDPYNYDEDKGLFSEIGLPLFWLLLLALLTFFIFRYGCKVLDKGAEVATEVVDSAKDGANDVVDTVTDVVSGNGSKNVEYTGKYSDVLTPEIIDQGCVIVVGSFKKSRNALRMREKIIAKGYQPYDEYHNGFNRVGLIFECLDKDLIDFIQEVRRDIEPKAWYRIPGFEVAYER